MKTWLKHPAVYLLVALALLVFWRVVAALLIIFLLGSSLYGCVNMFSSLWQLRQLRRKRPSATALAAAEHALHCPHCGGSIKLAKE